MQNKHPRKKKRPSDQAVSSSDSAENLSFRMLIEGLKIRAFSLEPAVNTGLLKTLKTKPEMTKIAPAAKSAGMVTI